VHAKDESRHNTPPVFAIYICGLVFKWILRQGGLEVMGEAQQREGRADLRRRSTRRRLLQGPRPRRQPQPHEHHVQVPDPELDDMFIKEAGKLGIDGSRATAPPGGMRASTYNAMPREGAQALAQFMREFARKNG
jgi:phosphoserine aminotransferase